MSAESKVAAHLNLQGSAELRNAVLRSTAFIALASPPASPVIGEVFYHTTSNCLKVWNGAEWQALAASAAPVANTTVYGSGLDGDVTISVDTTLSSNKHYNNLTIAAGVSLDTNGWQVFVAGTLTLNDGSRIHCNGNNAVGATAGAARSANFYGLSGAGANGSASGAANAPTVSSSVGSAGGKGGYASPGSSWGGNGGNAAPVQASDGGKNMFVLITSLQTGRVLSGVNGGKFNGGTGGGAGFGSSLYSGAGGGSGGSICVVFAYIITVNGAATVSSNGGSGGNASAGNGGGGGGGGGGACAVIASHAIPSGLTVSAAGGVGGTGFGTGQTGQTGTNGLSIYVVAN